MVSYVGACAADLVIHLGDLSVDGAGNAADLRHRRVQLDRLPAAWRAVPGNHDIGDNPWPGAPAGGVVDAGRHRRWLDIIGADYWWLTVNGWIVLAVNAQLLGSGLPAAAAQWSWLEEQAGRRRGGRPVALVTHKPVTAAEAELAAAPPRQYRRLRLDGTDHLWVPTTWAGWKWLPRRHSASLAPRAYQVEDDLVSAGAQRGVRACRRMCL